MTYTTMKTILSKMVKYKKICSDNQRVFIPFVFDTFNFLASEGVDILKSLKSNA
jgi:hypothetical protein